MSSLWNLLDVVELPDFVDLPEDDNLEFLFVQSETRLLFLEWLLRNIEGLLKIELSAPVFDGFSRIEKLRIGFSKLHLCHDDYLIKFLQCVGESMERDSKIWEQLLIFAHQNQILGKIIRNDSKALIDELVNTNCFKKLLKTEMNFDVFAVPHSKK